ncbi:MAG: c-type cytochrome [Bacillota bacterium]
MVHFLKRPSSFFYLILALLLGEVAHADQVANPDILKKGQGLFAKHCTSCHGDKADGHGPAAEIMNPRPINLTSDKFKHGDTPQNIFDSLTAGIHGTSMPSFNQLSKQERWALTYYINSLRKNGGSK